MPSTHTFITIVSGYPRSGTSLMMQMLEAGGLPVLRDEQFAQRMSAIRAAIHVLSEAEGTD
jgi:hypothetical protein